MKKAATKLKKTSIFSGSSHAVLLQFCGILFHSVAHAQPQTRREDGVGGLATLGLATFGGPRGRPEILCTPECTILKRKVQKFCPQRGPARMFPQAPLWLSMGLHKPH